MPLFAVVDFDWEGETSRCSEKEDGKIDFCFFQNTSVKKSPVFYRCSSGKYRPLFSQESADNAALFPVERLKRHYYFD